MSNDLRRKIFYSLVIALLIYVGLALWSDWQELTQALIRLSLAVAARVIGLTLVNYAGPAGQMALVSARGGGAVISWFDSARIFGVGMLMVMTPGKAGEFLKSYMVKNVTGTPMSVTAPVDPGRAHDRRHGHAAPGQRRAFRLSRHADRGMIAPSSFLPASSPSL